MLLKLIGVYKLKSYVHIFYQEAMTEAKNIYIISIPLL